MGAALLGKRLRSMGCMTRGDGARPESPNLEATRRMTRGDGATRHDGVTRDDG